ncbi:acetyltransferase [Janibacter indicus]|uniref:acetyltransferase n=1 Tax=Janibacter indicus TaxID=857417 RepID=UPI003D9A9D81
MTHDLVIIGAGGFGRETLDVVRAINDITPTWDVLGFADDALSEINSKRLNALSVPHLGGLTSIPNGTSVAVAVGNPTTRRAIVHSLGDRYPFPALVHPTTVCGSQLRHGEGLIVLSGVSLGTNVTLGDHVHLNAHAVIGHDTRLHNFVSVNPNATISGECDVGEQTLIGATSTVLQGLTVGSRVTLGAAACLTKDSPDHATLVGVPARPLHEGPTS